MSIERTLSDLRLALRGLLRAKAFAAAAVLTLAVGIAGATTMFALVEGVLLRPLPVRDQERLLVAWKTQGESGHWPFDIADIDRLRERTRTFSSLAGLGYNGALPWAVVDGGTPATLRVASVTGDFFNVLGVDPVIGRSLRRTDDEAGGERVLVISHGLWQRRYGSRRDVIGRRLLVEQQPFTVVGVMPRDFELPRGADVWTTVAGFMSVRTNPAFHVSVDLVARLRDGVTIEQATSDLATAVAQLDAIAAPGQPKGLTLKTLPYEEVIVGDVRLTMIVLFGAVGLVLLIAAANVANLLLLRGEARRAELAVRAALGASRFALVRHILAESAVLALASGAVGLFTTWWTLQAFISIVPGSLPRAESVHMDPVVVIFAVALVCVVAAMAGLGPAMTSTSTNLVSQLRSGARGVTRSVTRTRRLLVVTQVALAILTVSAAGLLIRSLLKLENVGLGLDADRLVLVPLELPQPKYAARERHLQFLQDVLSALEATPEIVAATPVNVVPLSGSGWDARITGEGQTAAASATSPVLNLEAIHPNYFETLEVPVVRGRPFNAADRQGAQNVAIVSEDVAAHVWPGKDPIGKRLKIGDVDSRDPWRTVVGVARATRYRELADPAATLYVPAEQFLVTAQTLVVRTPLPLDAIAQVVRERVGAIDPDVQMMRAVSFLELLERPLARPRFSAIVVGVFALSALLLAGVGVYAVMSAFVRHRYREIGIRLALGATVADVRGLVVGEGLRLAGAGTAIGLVIALGSAPAIRGLLYDVHPLDPITIVAAALLLVAVSAAATYLPTRWATRIDPVVTLRADS